MKGAARIVLLYVVFAAITTAVNIGCQALSIWLYSGPHAVPISVLVGTAAGLPLKYVLEKKYVFEFASDNLAHDGRMFVLYSLMGVLTTLLFWGVEYTFERAFGTDGMRYLGGAIGLALGYAIKYRLDLRFVFVDARARGEGLQ